MDTTTNTPAQRMQSIRNQLADQSQYQFSEAPKKFIQQYRQKSKMNKKDFETIFYGSNNQWREEFFKLVKNNPKVFQQPHLNEMNREQQRYQAFKEIKFFSQNTKLNLDEYKKDPNVVTMTSLGVYQWNNTNCIKHGVHFALYMRTILNLGTKKHEPYITRASELVDIGSFSLTELGHGSNVKNIQTTAVYDEKTNTFTINSPSDFAMKFWIGATAELANMTVCWAQLYIGETCYGVHAFLVPIRDKNNHLPMPGVQIGDCGPKNGFEGIDNGWLVFKNVSIPYDNLLDRFSRIEGGKFISEYSENKRFALQLGSLSGGRVIISIQGTSFAIQSISIGVRYACVRAQFGPPKSPEQPIIEYPLVQYRLMPILARTVVQHIGCMGLSQVWDANVQYILELKNNLMNELHAISSSIKAKVGWWTQQTIQISREVLGGHGFSLYNRLGFFARDNDINMTWEGDNYVLLQQTGKFLLDGLKRIVKGKENPFKSLDFLTLNPVEELRFPCNVKEDFFNTKSLLQALQFKVNLLTQRAGMKLQENFQATKDAYQSWNNVQVFYIQDASLAFGDIFLAKEMIRAIENSTDEYNKLLLTRIYMLWILYTINNDLGTFREGGYINDEQAKLIKDTIPELCKQLVDDAVAITDVIAPPDFIMGAPMGASDGDVYKKYLTLIQSSKNCYGRVNWWREIHPEQ